MLQCMSPFVAVTSPADSISEGLLAGADPQPGTGPPLQTLYVASSGSRKSFELDLNRCQVRHSDGNAFRLSVAVDQSRRCKLLILLGAANPSRGAKNSLRCRAPQRRDFPRCPR